MDGERRNVCHADCREYPGKPDKTTQFVRRRTVTSNKVWDDTNGSIVLVILVGANSFQWTEKIEFGAVLDQLVGNALVGHYRTARNFRSFVSFAASLCLIKFVYKV